jgi:superfamily II DNA or RNA helicase
VEQVAGGDIRVLFSTLSLIGEGFDCPGMDALFLASPVKFSGRLKQVVGRVLRPAEGKEPLVFDYHDIRAGVLSHQWRSRQKEFQRMGAK